MFTEVNIENSLHIPQTLKFRLFFSNDWKLDLASDNYFANPQLYYRELDIKKVEQLFNKYRDANVDRVLPNGIIKFLEDLNLSPESRLVLILAFKFGEKYSKNRIDNFSNP